MKVTLRQLRTQRHGHRRTCVSLGFVLIPSRALFVPPKADASVNLVLYIYMCIHLFKPMASVQMISGKTCTLEHHQKFQQVPHHPMRGDLMTVTFWTPDHTCDSVHRRTD